MEKPDITDIIENVNKKENENKGTSNIENIEHLKALEIAKIIVKETLNPLNIQSLSFLELEQIDDIVKARLLNSYYNIPEINDYIDNYLQLKRSHDGQLLKLFIKMVMFNNEIDDNNKKGFFSRILKRN